MTANALRPVDTSLKAAPGAESPTAYSSLHEHLLDLAERFDLQIKRKVLRLVQEEESERLSYAAVTGREVLALLSRSVREGTKNVAPSDAHSIGDSIADLGRRIRERVVVTLAQGTRLPWIDIVSWFGLSEQEADVLLACFATTLDSKYERVFAYLHNDVGRRQPTIGWLLEICCSNNVTPTEAYRIFGASGILLSSQLLRLADDIPDRIPLCQRTICIDDRIAAFLAGTFEFDTRIGDCMGWASRIALDAPDAVDTAVSKRLLTSIRSDANSQKWTASPTFYLYGASSTNKMLIAQNVCRAIEVPLVRVGAEHLAALPIGFHAGIPLVIRESFLQHAALYLDNLEAVLEEDPGGLRLRALIQSLDMYQGAPIFLGGERPWRWTQTPTRGSWLPVELKKPAYSEQIANWKLALAGSVEFSDQDVSKLASIHPLPLPQATTAVQTGKATAALRGDCRATLPDVARACRDLSQANFGQLARKIEGELGWNDLVLPAEALDQLRDICVQAKYRCHVYGTWGFADKLPLGKGLNVLFSGKSGTGKTMSAQIIANDIGVDLYKIDLSQVVSKYIGETEKNLHQIFTIAQTANAILFFDEADALLGKRSDIKDAHDRYANLEVAYLLQKMEEYEGITILATNLRRNIDDAFARRIRFIVDFPFPSEDDRLRIWRQIWPKKLPLSADVDLGRLARQFKFSGGNIRNIAVCAAFLAAESNEPVAMRHLTVAIKRELQKTGRLLDAESCEGLDKP